MRLENENLIRSYLLGTLPQARGEELEQRLLTDDDLAEELSLVEEELTEDYARNALNAADREQFEKYYLTTPKRRQKLMLVRGFKKYASDVGPGRIADVRPSRPWYHVFQNPQWRTAAAVLLIFVAGAGVWRLYFYRNDVDKGLLALNEAYKAARPVEARVTGLGYAPFSVTRGPNDVNSRELDRSAALLLNAASEKPNPESLHALGRLYLLNREFDKAIQQFEEAIKTTPNNAQLQSDLGAALLEKGKLERATDQSGRSETTLASSLVHLNRALELNDSLLDARFNRALLYEEMRLTPQALQDWQKYLTFDSNSRWADEARKKLEQIQKQGATVSQRDEDLFRDFQQARTSGDEETVWRVFSKAHLRNGNSITNKLVDEYLNAATGARSKEATESLQALTQLGKLSNDKTGDRFTSDLAAIYRSANSSNQNALLQARKEAAGAYELFSRSKQDQAILLYQRARTVFEQLGDYPEALLASFWINFCVDQQGDPERSLPLFEQLETECERRGYKWLRSITLIGLANSHGRRREYSSALDYAHTSYKIATENVDQNGMLRGLNSLASFYREIGNFRLSLRMAQQGLDLGTEISADASQMVGFYATSAWDFNYLSHYAAALEFEKQALHLGQQMNNPLVLSRYQVQMGLIQGMLKNYDQAIQNIRLGIEAGESVGQETIREEITSYGQLELGRAYRESGQIDAALAALAGAESYTQKNVEQVWLLHEVKKEQLLAKIAQGDVTGAQQELARVIAAYEDQRDKILEESNRRSFFDKEQSIYDVAVDFALSQLRNAQQAFDYSESSRARSLLDTSTGDWRVADEDRTPDLRFSSTSKPMPLDQLRANLPPRAQLLQFAVLKDKLIVWYLSRERFEHAVVNISSDALMDKVDRLLALITTPPRDNINQLQTIAAELYNLLIAPVAQFLDQGKQLCIVPDKILNLLPFNVLFSSSSQRYLIEDFALSYASSANLLVRDSELATTKDRASERLLGVGNPSFDRSAFTELADLPSASLEVEKIAGLYEPSSVLLRGPEAKKSQVLNAIRDVDVLHLASHYLPNTASPMMSKLILAGNTREPSDTGVLHPYEVYRLKPLRVRLAVLAGCRTGVEGYVNGEGAIGLGRPFSAAGVPLVVASLWSVDSQATTELMIEFHRLRKQKSLSSAQALQAAQVQMLKNGNPSYRSPYYWASFSLTGGYSDY